jgi:preprotein translocase subunit SecF
MARGNWGAALYRGEISYDFVGRRRRWYAISAVLVVLSLYGLLFHGLNRSIEFKGGDVFEFPGGSHSVSDARDAAEGAGVDIGEPIVTKNSQGTIRVETEPLTGTDAEDKVLVIQQAIASKFGLSVGQVATQEVGPTWGKQITNKAIKSLIVFLVLVTVFISIRFEFKMAISAIVALVHDLLLTVGVYALLDFTVSPATVIGLLTILGYSLYDTVVVFDKVRENTAGIVGGNRMTYSQAANLAVNQTLVRSINTSVIALLPVASILIVGSYVLGAGTLKDLSLALFVGIASGTYSSIFIATPLLCDLKEREPQMKLLAKRVEARVAAGKPAGAYAGGASSGGTGRTATAVLDPGTDGADFDGDSADGEGGGQPVAANRPTSGGARRPPPRRRSSSKRRGGRPGGRKRR